MRNVSIGRAVWAGLLGVTLLLGAISALAVAGIFDARQDYEDKLADSYDLQISAGRLLTAGVLEAAVLQRTGQRAERARSLAREAFEEEARTAQRLAASDPDSEEIVRRRIDAQERHRQIRRRRRRLSRLIRWTGEHRARHHDDHQHRSGAQRHPCRPHAPRTSDCGLAIGRLADLERRRQSLAIDP